MVPADLGDRHERALRMALALAADSAYRVTLLHVVQRVWAITVGEFPGFYRRLVNTADRRLRQIARPFVKCRIDVRTEVRIGEPAVEIIRAAQRERIDALVMGSHKVTGSPDARRTTSYKMGIFSQCPILLVK
jgi:nucleotide-binding universal stress UspA family protein